MGVAQASSSHPHRYRAAHALHAIAFAVVVMIASSRASAGAPAWNTEPHTQEAIDRLARGRSLYKLQRWDDAIAEFEAGALAEPTLPIWLWNLGQTHRQAGHYEKAAWYYERFIADSQTDPGAAEPIKHARQFVVDMHAAASREPRALAPDAAVAARPPANVAGTSETAASPATVPPPTAEDKAPRWYEDRVAWGLVGVGVVGAGVGGGLLLHADSLNGQAARETNFDERTRLRDRASSQRTAGTVSTAIGGAVLVAALVKLALVPAPRASRAAAHISPGPGDAGLALSFDF
jgi:tetratricopeptide (TPR) repeat protein